MFFGDLLADLIESFATKFHDVESIKAELGMRKVLFCS